MRWRIILTFLAVILAAQVSAQTVKSSAPFKIAGDGTLSSTTRTREPAQVPTNVGTAPVHDATSFKFTQSVSVPQITISADGTIVIHRALDLQTVLCIERQSEPQSYLTIRGGNTVPTPGFSHVPDHLTYPPEKQHSKLVVEAPKPAPIPSRVCRTVEAWLEDRR